MLNHCGSSVHVFSRFSLVWNYSYGTEVWNYHLQCCGSGMIYSRFSFEFSDFLIGIQTKSFGSMRIRVNNTDKLFLETGHIFMIIFNLLLDCSTPNYPFFVRYPLCPVKVIFGLLYAQVLLFENNFFSWLIIYRYRVGRVPTILI